MQLLFSISGSDLTVATWISCSYSDVSQGFIVELPNISDPYHAIRSNYVCTHCINFKSYIGRIILITVVVFETIGSGSILSLMYTLLVVFDPLSMAF